VIVVDLQGHGRTADVERPLRLELMADDIAALIRRLGLGRVDIAGYSLGGGVALLAAVRHPQVVSRLVLVSTLFRRGAFYPEILALQAQVGAEAAEAMKQTPMYQSYASVAPRPEDWPRLLAKIGEFMARDYDYGKQVAGIQGPVLIVAGDADIFPPAHAVEMFALLGGGQRDGNWDGSGKPKSQLAILPGRTHYDILAAPWLVEIVAEFLDSAPRP
jgi:pimeloyl-ACP methyl ester carboxylesterase